MRTGVVYPQIELGGDVGAVKAFAQAAEGLGYDHLLVYDHVLGAEHAGREPTLTGPYTESDPFHEPLVMFGYLAGITERIELVTGVIILPQRQTALVAKQAADVDLYSGGRLRLGVGVGWNWVEYEALEVGDYWGRRGARQAEQVELMRKLWSGELVEHTDTDHAVVRAKLLPAPKRQIPVWFGGFSPPAYDRAARIGDGFIFSGRQLDVAVEAKERIETTRAEIGREDAFGFESIMPYTNGSDRWLADLERWRQAGGSHASVVTMGAGLTTVDEHIDAIESWHSAAASA
ncbi:MAG: LLM class F420-dependent oxidoreductase [Acidimicrobiales bacterium]